MTKNQTDHDHLPYYRTYTRIISVFGIICIPLFLIATEFRFPQFAVGFWTYGAGFSTIWGPVLAYAGARTKHLPDFVIGLLLTASSVFWIRLMLTP